MEDFCTYEQSVKLNELGYDWMCNHYYESKKLKSEVDTIFYDRESETEVFNAPTLAHAAKWLRKVKGLFIEVWLCAAGFSWVIRHCNPYCNGYGTLVSKHDYESGDNKYSGLFTTYEKALSAGITEALNFC